MLEDIKYRQIEQRLLRELRSPTYKVSDKLPSETALMKTFDASKVTIRKALKRLEDDGIILCEHGKRRVLLRKPPDITKIRSGMSFGLFLQSEYLTLQDDLLGVAQGLSAGLREWNAELALLPICGGISELEYAKRIMGRNMVDGLFIANLAEGAEIVEYLGNIHIPCVLLSNMEHEHLTPVPVPHVCLKEREILNAFARRFKKIWVVGNQGASLARTCELLHTDLPFEICAISPQDCEAPLAKRLDELREDELLLLASLDLLRPLDVIARRAPQRQLHENVLVFKHSPVDLSDYKGRYLVFDRPVKALGNEAARQMRAVILRENSGNSPSQENVCNVDAVIHVI